MLNVEFQCGSSNCSFFCTRACSHEYYPWGRFICGKARETDFCRTRPPNPLLVLSKILCRRWIHGLLKKSHGVKLMWSGRNTHLIVNKLTKLLDAELVSARVARQDATLDSRETQLIEREGQTTYSDRILCEWDRASISRYQLFSKAS